MIMTHKQESRILNFKAASHLANNDPQTLEQKEILALKVQTIKNSNRLLTMKMMLDNAKSKK